MLELGQKLRHLVLHGFETLRNVCTTGEDCPDLQVCVVEQVVGCACQRRSGLDWRHVLTLPRGLGARVSVMPCATATWRTTRREDRTAEAGSSTLRVRCQR